MRQRSRLTVAVMLSLLAHAFVMSLQFGLPGLGLPGLELPWHQRRAQADGLRVVLMEATRPEQAANQQGAVAAAGSAGAGTQMPKSAEARPYTSLPARPRVQLAPADMPVSAAPAARAGVAKPVRAPATSKPRQRRQPAPAATGPRLLTQDDMGQETFSVPLPVLDGPARTAAAPSGALPELVPPALPDEAMPAEPTAPDQEQMRADEQAALRMREAEARALEEQREVQELEARRQAQALAMQERQRREEQEQTRRALELEAQRQEEKRLQDIARAEREAQELDARRQAEDAAQQQAQQRRQEEENARREQEMQVMEARKREELRLQEAEHARREAMEREARRQAQEVALRQKQAEELAAKERAQAEAQAAAARQREQAMAEREAAAASPALPRNAPGISLAARALEQARKTGDMQSSPALQAPLPRPMPEPMPQAADPARRRSVLGRVDHDVGLMMYVESWRLKIERNGRLNYRQSLVDSAYTEPIVTVAVRSDGSVEEIIFHRSSGRPELDEAVRRIIRLNARYAAFPPELARRFDVIEIRRAWRFDEQLRLLEEVR
ncbi:TonB C-terminal domain-containing protein [Noviherbaspirillum autotrophicum]|uniref:TonB C-terminal domain-containing protein n=1 Tax=Noviherbaspirillum autotrophicum TaxID=709839 RepID=UPI0012FD1566|nr:TonB C-terminal domain-containing protein [Noviherbaspirillum autotrophicum]